MASKTSAPRGQGSADWFEQSMAAVGRLQPGQPVDTVIVAMSGDSVFLELGGKSEGVLDRAELVGKDGELTRQVGDAIKVYFLDSKSGEMRFTTRLAGENAGTAMLESAWQNHIPVEGVVEKEIKGGFEVKIGSTRAFCPHSQMGRKRGEADASWIGKHCTFLIQEYKDRGRSIVVSNRAVEELAHQERLESLKQTLQEGQTVHGTVVRVEDYGAFVEFDGVQALLPVSEVSRERVADIRTRVSLGQELDACVIKLDWKNERITLSLKVLEADPWLNARERYPEGSRHAGTVVRTADYGVFVQLEPGLDGLLHVSELSDGGNRNDARKLAKVGDRIDVRVLGVDAGQRRISLGKALSAEDESLKNRYVDQGGETEGYNPFAALLKK